MAEEGGYRHDTTTIITTAHKGLGVWGPAHLAKARKEPSKEGGSIGGCHYHYWNNGSDNPNVRPEVPPSQPGRR